MHIIKNNYRCAHTKNIFSILNTILAKCIEVILSGAYLFTTSTRKKHIRITDLGKSFKILFPNNIDKYIKQSIINYKLNINEQNNKSAKSNKSNVSLETMVDNLLLFPIDRLNIVHKDGKVSQQDINIDNKVLERTVIVCEIILDNLLANTIKSSTTITYNTLKKEVYNNEIVNILLQPLII